jgi:hypothetical protein
MDGNKNTPNPNLQSTGSFNCVHLYLGLGYVGNESIVLVRCAFEVTARQLWTCQLNYSNNALNANQSSVRVNPSVPISSEAVRVRRIQQFHNIRQPLPISGLHYLKECLCFVFPDLLYQKHKPLTAEMTAYFTMKAFLETSIMYEQLISQFGWIIFFDFAIWNKAFFCPAFERSVEPNRWFWISVLHANAEKVTYIYYDLFTSPLPIQIIHNYFNKRHLLASHHINQQSIFILSGVIILL